jgi:hypothetical protein
VPDEPGNPQCTRYMQAMASLADGCIKMDREMFVSACQPHILVMYVTIEMQKPCSCPEGTMMTTYSMMLMTIAVPPLTAQRPCYNAVKRVGSSVYKLQAMQECFSKGRQMTTWQPSQLAMISAMRCPETASMLVQHHHKTTPSIRGEPSCQLSNCTIEHSKTNEHVPFRHLTEIPAAAPRPSTC